MNFRVFLAAVTGLCIYRFDKAWLKWAASGVLLATCIYAACINNAPIYNQSHEIITLLVYSGLFCFTKRLWGDDKPTIIAFWTSVVAGITTDLFSSNGPINFALGGPAAALIALTYFCRRFDKQAAFTVIFVLCIVTSMVIDFSNTICGEGNAVTADLRFKMPSGPFKGIFKTPARGKVLTELQADLQSFTDRKTTLYVIGAPGYSISSFAYA